MMVVRNLRIVLEMIRKLTGVRLRNFGMRNLCLEGQGLKSALGTVDPYGPIRRPLESTRLGSTHSVFDGKLLAR